MLQMIFTFRGSLSQELQMQELLSGISKGSFRPWTEGSARLSKGCLYFKKEINTMIQFCINFQIVTSSLVGFGKYLGVLGSYAAELVLIGPVTFVFLLSNRLGLYHTSLFPFHDQI